MNWASKQGEWRELVLHKRVGRVRKCGVSVYLLIPCAVIVVHLVQETFLLESAQCLLLGRLPPVRDRHRPAPAAAVLKYR